MGKTFIANWKSHKTSEETRLFFDEFTNLLINTPQEDKEIIICPSFPFLQYATDFTRANDIRMQIGAQNISEHDQGAFTGEVSATQLKNIATHVIIGHSERRRMYQETEEIVAKKVSLAKSAGLKVILCLQNEHEKAEDVDYIAYEPPSAIGTGNPDDPKHIEEVIAKIKQQSSTKILYGGSVDEKNAQDLSSIPGVQGFLIGGASLRPDSFFQIINKC